MEIQKEITIAFIGDKIFNKPNNIPDSNLENVIRTELYYVLEELYQEGKKTFLCGMTVGFAMLCAEEVLKLKSKHPNMILIAAIPFVGQELTYSLKDKQRYKEIYEAADHRVFTSNGDYDQDAYRKNNDWMVANSSELIIYDSNAASLVSMARNAGVDVLNMFDELQDYFTITHPAKEYLQNFPHITSFCYGREGVIFEGNNQPFAIKFSQIEKIEHKKEFLCFFLSDGLKIFASLTSNEVRVPSVRFSVN